MSWLERQWELKLELLESLSRSQRAVASMLDNIAMTASSHSTDSSDIIVRELTSIAKYQQVLARRILDIRMNPVRKGEPASPWISERPGLCSSWVLTRNNKFRLIKSMPGKVDRGTERRTFPI
ncbi:hypothetical protein [Paenibacillus senegalensis]|uniref:hypothetical protein n=1 Tax=Paenibacillus senegalensis TaxID=1465766 RepID=UPI000288040F|nr:hypothetical protein [Paenibacillus senegalensis]